ncbi:MAG TPA: hypothetical protein PKE64_27120, partial [Anaerolineae bacterium]|nr:hypothetical protein [Anaerolineae bacterium]
MTTLSPLKRLNKASSIAEPDAPPAASLEPSTGLLMPLEPEPAGTPIQRGFISEARSERLRLQLWLADNIRKSIAPDLSLDLPLERTPEREHLVRQRYQQVLARTTVKVPTDIP